MRQILLVTKPEPFMTSRYTLTNLRRAGLAAVLAMLVLPALVHAQTANRAWPYWGGRPSVNYAYPNYGNAYPAYGNNYANYPGYSGNSNGYPALWYPSVPELTRMPQGPPATNQGTEVPRSSAAAAPMTELITPPADRAGIAGA